MNPLSDYMVCKYFVPFYGLSFHFVSFAVQKLFTLMKSHVLIFAFGACTFGIKAKCLWRLALTALGVHTGSWPLGGRCGWGMWCIGGSRGPVRGICKWARPQQLTGRFPDGSTVWLVGSVPLGYPLRDCSPSPWVAQHSLYSGWDRNKWVSLAVSCKAGNTGHSHALTSPVGEITGQEGLFWRRTVLPWGRRDMDKVKWSLSPSSMHPILDFFSSQWCAGTSPWEPGLSQRLWIWVVV